MIYWPLFWKEITLRRKAWIQTPCELLLMAFTLYLLHLIHIALSDALKLFMTEESFSKNESSPLLNKLDSLVAFYPSTYFVDLVMDDGKQTDKTGFVIEFPGHYTTLTTIALTSESGLNDLVQKYYSHVLFGITFYEQKSRRILTNYSIINNGIHIKLRPTFFHKQRENIREYDFGIQGINDYRELGYSFRRYGYYLQYLEKQILQKIIGAMEPIEFNAPQPQTGKFLDFTNFSPDTIMLSIGTVLTLYVLVKRMIVEKSTKLRELMRLSGVSNTPYYITLFTFNFAIVFLYSMVCVSMYTNICDPVVLVVVYTLFAISSVLFAMAFTTIFNNKIAGNTTFVILWLGLSAILMAYIPLPMANKEREVYCFLACIFAPPTYTVGIFKNLCIVFLIYKRKVLTMDKLSSGVETQEFLTPLLVIVALICSCIFWLLCLLYIGEVWPWQEGIPKPWHFPVSSFMKQNKERGETMPPKNNEYFENTSPDWKCAIKVENIRKRFGFSREVLKGVNLEIFYGQITVLLGHNGAGKTTLMSIMTGLFPATSGRITVNGFDIEKETSEARKSVGLCTQTNIQFEQFTIEEHLYFFGLIKGCSLSDMEPEIDRVLKLLKLEDKRFEKPSAISGGMRRKLQIAMAFIGGSSVLILDEPSSGLDVETRRVIWDMLLAVRKSYVILITTHHMEEADCLGDRIAIMSHGEVKCCGTPMFLKRAFGIGYFIRIAKTEKFNRKQCEQILVNHLPSVQFRKDSPTDILYSFKKDEASKLPHLFDQLDDKTTKENLGIASVGISVTSMDDVFLKVGTMFDKNESPDTTKLALSTLVVSNRTPQWPLFALFLKRFHNTKRKMLPCIFFFGSITFFSFLMCFFTSRTGQPLSDEWSIDLNFAALNLQSRHGICANNTWFCNKAKQIGRTFKIDILFSNVTYNDFNQSLSEEAIFGIFVKHLDFDEPGKIHQAIDILAEDRDTFIVMIVRTIIMNTLYALKTDSDIVLMTVSFNPQKTVNQFFAPPTDLLIFIPLMYLVLSVYPLLYPSAERESDAKLLQMMTGIRVTTYWLSNLIFDVLLILFYSIPFFLFIFLYYFAMDSITVFDDYLSSGLFFTAMIIFFLTTTTMSHLLSFIFNGLALVFMALIGSFLAVLVIAALKIKFLSKFSKFLLDHVFPRYPLLAMNRAVTNISTYSHNKNFCEKIVGFFHSFCNSSVAEFGQQREFCCTKKYSNSLLTNFYEEQAIQIVAAITFFVAIIVIEITIKWWQRRKAEDHIYTVPDKEDADVTNLRVKAEGVFKSKGHKKYALTTLNVTKRFGHHTVVDHLTFLVDHKQCFGLLGVNGAGKTTTFKMLIGDVSMTYGESFVGGVSVFEPGFEYRKSIGYCPQFDAFVPNLTGKEMLYLFARLRGYKRSQLKEAVEKMIEFVDLQEYANYVADTYSGGNKRKLSIAIAMIGFPSLLFLDEPTAGVDPVARRKVWKIIDTCRENVGSSVVLTSHSMDECENLCSTIGIMVKGTFRCMGSTQRLKTKFGKGYTISLKLDGRLDNGIMVKNEMQKVLPKAYLKDSHATLLVYHYDDSGVSLGNVFRSLEMIKTQYKLEDYQLTDANLEQIFLGFAKGE